MARTDQPKDDTDVPIHGFLRDWKSYDLIPESAKVLVFDVDIPMRLAFYALVEHGKLPSLTDRQHMERLFTLFGFLV